MVISDLAEQALLAATKSGADAADVILVDGDSQSIEVRDGALEHAERSEGVEIGLRVLMGQRQSCVSASDTSAATLREMAERAVAMAREAPEDPFCGLADAGQLALSLDTTELELADTADAPSPSDLQRDALATEDAARSVGGVSQVDTAAAQWSRTSVCVAATNGFIGSYMRTSTSLSCVAITGEGLNMDRDYCAEGRVFAADMPSPEDIGTLAGQRAVARKGARKPPTGSFPVLFDERISSTLIGHLLGAINGASVARGSSWLKDAMDTAVLPSGISLVEDPFRHRVGGSRLFDAEGLPSKRRAIVEDGILKSWTLDLATARKLGLESTGNASRGPAAPPSPGMGNLELTPSDTSREALIGELGTGLIITSLIGSAINPTTGDYSRGASGLWVENGEITGPVNECTVAGNLREMLLSIRAANDGRAHLSRVIPSLLVERMTIAGA